MLNRYDFPSHHLGVGTLVIAGYDEYVLDPGEPKRTICRLAAYDDLSTMVGLGGVVGVLAGLVMYWLVSDWLSMDWITSTYGLSITVGALAGLAAFAIAITFIALTNNRSVELYESVADADQLTEAQAAEVRRLESRLRTGERAAAVFMVVAVVAMAVAQSL